jgi:uncharacterized protein YjbI with pentapeptide repeats
MNSTIPDPAEPIGNVTIVDDFLPPPEFDLFDLDKEQLEQLERLKRSVKEWNEWRKKNLEVEIKLREADLSGAKLNGANLIKADLHGANLSGADLSEASFNGAILRFTNLSEANLCNANLSNAYLIDAKLIKAVLIKAYLFETDLFATDLSEADLSEANLVGAKLSHANLSEANLFRADLFRSDLFRADLSGANLGEADLSRANALNTNFTRANLTGACIHDWNINQSTIFEEVICDYIYHKVYDKLGERKTYQERRPRDLSKVFNPGDFQRLIETARETVDLIFSDGINWKAFLESFHGLQIESENSELSITGILKKRDGTFVIQIDAPHDTDKAELENRFYQVYEQKLALIEQDYQAQLASKDQEITHRDRELLQLYREKSTDMTEIAKLLANRPMTIEAKAVSYGEIKQAGNFGVGVNQGEIKDNAKVAGILNEAEQQNLTEIITEVQAIITPLAQTYPNNPTTQGIKAIEAIENNPNLKQKLIEAAKKGGLEAFKKSLDNPVGAFIGGAIEGWMAK